MIIAVCSMYTYIYWHLNHLTPPHLTMQTSRRIGLPVIVCSNDVDMKLTKCCHQAPTLFGSPEVWVL